SRDLPQRSPLLHLDPAKAADVLRDRGEEVAPEIREGARAVRTDGARDLVADPGEGGGYDDEQPGAYPCPSHALPFGSRSHELLARVCGTVKVKVRRGAAPRDAHAGCWRHRSCHHTHSAGARRICASMAAVKHAVSSVTRPRPFPSPSGTAAMRTRCPPPGRRWMKAVITGARARSARSAAPGGVCAGRPKNGTKTPAPRVSWSISMATTRFRRSASPTAATKRGSSRTRTSTPAAARKRTMSEWKRRSFTRRTTTVIGYPRCATAAARSSQLPTCAAM